MEKYRVLVVDDSVVVRKIVSNTLVSDPEIEIAGIAANGSIALAKIPHLNPDIITLDIEMPVMDGIQTLIEIRKKYADLPVIMFSTLTERGGIKTLEALSLGATDYVTKPANVGSVSIAMRRIREELIPKIKMFGAKKKGITPPSAFIPEKTVTSSSSYKKSVSTFKRSPRIKQNVEIVTIGVSTGGPNALGELLPVIPADFPVPIVIVQHMPPFFTKLLAERLSEKSQIEVFEGSSGQLLSPGKAWIAPGDYHMYLEKRGTNVYVRTNQDHQENSCRPAVDVLFRSVARIYGPGALAVVMTGMGRDGLAGCESINNAEGQVLIQDEASSVVWGMPGFVAREGLADAIYPLDKLGDAITQKVKARQRKTTLA